MHKPRLICTPLTPLTAVQYTMQSAKDKQYDISIDFLLNYIDRNPPSSFLSRCLSYLFCQIYDFENAFLWINKSLDLDSSCSDTYAQQGFIYICLQQHGCAETAYRKSIIINPTSSLANCGLGLIYSAKNEIELSVEYFSRAYHFSPPNESLTILYARALMEANQYETALKELDHLMIVNLASYRSFELLGELYLIMDNVDLAKSMFEAALINSPNSSPDSVRSKLGLARTLLRTNHFEDADSLLNNLID